MRFSICVCTYNRADILPYCLQSLADLRIPSNCDVEILLVDNNSIDNTKRVVAEYAERSPIEISYIHEAEQGLSAARNRAMREACGDYIAFLDDECVVRSDWLDVVASDIKEFAPLIIGGPYVGAFIPGTAPKWFKAKYGDAYFLANQFQRGYQREFRASGGNIFLHRSIYKTQEFNPKFGMSGNELKLGEEIALQEAFMRRNPENLIFYEPGIQVEHYVLPHKMTLLYRARRDMESGAFYYKVSTVKLCLKVARALSYLILCPLITLFRDREAYPFWQNYAYERVIPQIMPVIGAAWEKIRRRYR